jgi:hypothetical protein
LGPALWGGGAAEVTVAALEDLTPLGQCQAFASAHVIVAMHG